MSEQEKRMDGSTPLEPHQLPHEIFKDASEEKGQSKPCSMEVTQEGDGSRGIVGSITIYDRQSAIMFIHSLMEQFDITKDEVDF